MKKKRKSDENTNNDRNSLKFLVCCLLLMQNILQHVCTLYNVHTTFHISIFFSFLNLQIKHAAQTHSHRHRWHMYEYGFLNNASFGKQSRSVGMKMADESR